MAPNQKNESGTNCWLTGPVKSAAVLSNEGNLKIFYNLEGIPMKALILNGLAESNHKLQHTFSKYQCAIIPEVEVALKTTLRASSQQGSGLSITAVSCSIIIRYLRSSALALFMQS